MLQVHVKTHRTHLRALGGPQKLFVLLKLLPAAAAARTRPRIHIAVVVDTSGSMRHKVATTAGTRAGKLAFAMEAVRQLVDSPVMRPDDRITIVQFDAEAHVVGRGQVGPDRHALLAGVDRLSQHSGITRMSAGLWTGAAELEQETETARKLLLLTDGQTLEPAECLAAAQRLLELQVPIVAIGLGRRYNEGLLRDLSNLTLGHPLDLRDLATLAMIFEGELGRLTRQVLREVELRLLLLQDVRLTSLTRVYPSIADIDLTQDALYLGQVESGDYTNYLLELDASERPVQMVRLAQLELHYRLVTTGQIDDYGPQDVVMTYTTDEALVGVVDDEVMGYVQQRNTDRLVWQATTIARTRPLEARQFLERARMITQQIGNTGMTIALGRAEEELRLSGTISPGTLKTIGLGIRTRTVRVEGSTGSAWHLPSDDEIRRVTGS